MNDVRHIQDLNVERNYLLRSMEHNPRRKLRADKLLHEAEVDWMWWMLPAPGLWLREIRWVQWHQSAEDFCFHLPGFRFKNNPWLEFSPHFLWLPSGSKSDLVRGKKHSFPTTGIKPPAHYAVHMGQAQDHNPERVPRVRHVEDCLPQRKLKP